MFVESIETEYDWNYNFGNLISTVEFSPSGIEKSNEFILNKIKDFNTVLFKGKITDKEEFKKLINKLLKENFNVSIIIEVNNKDLVKVKNVFNIKYIVYLNEENKYPDIFFQHYNSINTIYVIKKRFINKLLILYNLEKRKVVVQLEELLKENLEFCYLNGYDFTYNFEVIKNIYGGQ